MTSCPVRKLTPEGERQGPAVEHLTTNDGERWVVRSFDVARQVLRDSESVRQAGFGADSIDGARAKMRPPILYLEGAQHRIQRKAAARLFAPKVTEEYRTMMEDLSDQLVGQLRTDRSVDLSQLSLEMAARVTAQVVGLTSSSTSAMSRRLNTFFEGDFAQSRLDPRSISRLLRTQSALLRFFVLDVKPAIRARRKVPREDVISQLLDRGFSDAEVLTECVTYGAAGMVTTREFITIAAWHLLDDADLQRRYREGDIESRLDVLSEVLRLEPVVGHLYRRTTAPTVLSTPEGDHQLPAGSLIDLDLRAVNADPFTVQGHPMSLCPARDLPRLVPSSLMSLGDGNHKCPGGPIALMQSEIFLTRLLSRDVAFEGPPRVQWNAITAGYDLDRFMIRLAA